MVVLLMFQPLFQILNFRMMKFVLIICTALISVSFAFYSKPQQLKINWVNDLHGDFSFKNKWNYPEGVYKNKFGQVSCDGICPEGIDRMKNSSGEIIQDSLSVFYDLVDTSHQYHSLNSDARMYEYSGTEFMPFKIDDNGVIIGRSSMNAATHSSLNIAIEENSCKVWVDYNSIRNVGSHVFDIKSGTIQIDRQYFRKGIIKASFDFTFKNTLEPQEPLFWKGLIYSQFK